MAVKIKETIKSTPYQPRFDFDCSHASNDDQTATIRELLNELNRQKENKSIADYNLKSLGTTLRFICSISGIENPRRIDQMFPVTAIKTIKLLFKSSQFIDSHLIRIIEMPGKNTLATLDFFTSPATTESADVERHISRMISTLEKEIGKDEIAWIEQICDPMRLREKYRQDTNEAVDKILLTHIHVDDDLMEKADDYLADRTREFLGSITPLQREPRLHVAMYTYLKLLDYVNRLHFEISTQLTIPSDRIVENKQIDFDETCRKLSATHNRTIAKDTNFMSIDEVSSFIDGYSSDIARLVSIATGFTYNKRDILGKKKNEPSQMTDSIRALIALQIYLLGANLPNEKNPKPIGVVHVIAAFCSVLHQRKIKSKSEKKSRRYGPQFATPQKQIDAYIGRKSEHIPYTAQFVYRERTRWYVHALLGRKDKADAHIALQIAQSELSKDIFLSLNHVWIREQNSVYRDFMIKAAHDFVALHKKQSTTYKWIHGG